MTVVKRLLFVVTVATVMLAGIGLALPTTWQVERSIWIRARKPALEAMILDLRRWPEWAHWDAGSDPKEIRTFEGAPYGAGATMSWKGRSGRGNLVITEVEHLWISYATRLEDRVDGGGRFTFVEEIDRTQVTWLDYGDFGSFFPGRFFVWALERRLGDHYTEALRRLKVAAELQADRQTWPEFFD